MTDLQNIVTLPFACGWALGVCVRLISVQYYHISRTSRPEKVITCSVLLSPVLFHSFLPSQLRQRAAGIYFPSVDLWGPELSQAIKNLRRKSALCQCVYVHMNVKENAKKTFTHLCEIFHSSDINNIDRQFQHYCYWRKTTYFYVKYAAGSPVILSPRWRKAHCMWSDLKVFVNLTTCKIWSQSIQLFCLPLVSRSK